MWEWTQEVKRRERRAHSRTQRRARRRQNKQVSQGSAFPSSLSILTTTTTTTHSPIITADQRHARPPERLARVLLHPRHALLLSLCDDISPIGRCRRRRSGSGVRRRRQGRLRRRGIVPSLAALALAEARGDARDHFLARVWCSRYKSVRGLREVRGGGREMKMDREHRSMVEIENTIARWSRTGSAQNPLHPLQRSSLPSALTPFVPATSACLLARGKTPSGPPPPTHGERAATSAAPRRQRRSSASERACGEVRRGEDCVVLYTALVIRCDWTTTPAAAADTAEPDGGQATLSMPAPRRGGSLQGD